MTRGDGAFLGGAAVFIVIAACAHLGGRIQGETHQRLLMQQQLVDANHARYNGKTGSWELIPMEEAKTRAVILEPEVEAPLPTPVPKKIAIKR